MGPGSGFPRLWHSGPELSLNTDLDKLGWNEVRKSRKGSGSAGRVRRVEERHTQLTQDELAAKFAMNNGYGVTIDMNVGRRQ